MLATFRKRPNVRRFEARKGRTPRDSAPMLIRSSDGMLEVALSHPWPDKDRLSEARPVPLEIDPTEIRLPGVVDARAMLQCGEGVLDVLHVQARIASARVVTGVSHDVSRPVGRLRQLLTSLREEDVAEDHTADGWVRIDRGSGPRAVGLSSQQQLSLAGHTVGRPPDRPRLADLQLDVLIEEAPANEVIPRDIEALELLRVLGLEEKRLTRRQRLEAVRRRLPEVGLREGLRGRGGRPPTGCL